MKDKIFWYSKFHISLIFILKYIMNIHKEWNYYYYYYESLTEWIYYLDFRLVNIYIYNIYMLLIAKIFQ